MADVKAPRGPVKTSPEAEALLEAGAAPTTTDPDAMLRQIQALQARMDQMSQAQGIPSDPVEAAVLNLKAHVKAHGNATPQHDYSEVNEALEGLSDPPTRDETELVKLAIEAHDRRVNRHADTAYLVELAGDLHKAVLKAE